MYGSFFNSTGDVSKVGYFFDISISIADNEFKIKSLYSNDLILNIAVKSKEIIIISANADCKST